MSTMIYIYLAILILTLITYLILDELPDRFTVLHVPKSRKIQFSSLMCWLRIFFIKYKFQNVNKGPQSIPFPTFS